MSMAQGMGRLGPAAHNSSRSPTPDAAGWRETTQHVGGGAAGGNNRRAHRRGRQTRVRSVVAPASKAVFQGLTELRSRAGMLHRRARP